METNQERSDQPSQPANGASHIPSDAPPLSGRVVVLGLVLLMIVTVVVAVAGIVPRIHARSKLKQDTDALAAPNVIMNPPKQGQTAQEIVLPANIYAYSDASLYARTDGYLSKWYFDIGAHVREGQLLAVISTPEVDKQLLQARADLAYGPSQRRLGQDQLHPLPGIAHAKRRVQARYGHLRQPGSIYQLHG